MENVIVFIVLMGCGFIFGQWAEKRHFKSVIEREKALAHILTFNEPRVPEQVNVRRAMLVGGNVVISIDYFKKITAVLRMLVGGRVRAYESLLERARREAILRMKEDAASQGADWIFNTKLETASISKGTNQQVGSVEVYAYGTALITR